MNAIPFSVDLGLSTIQGVMRLESDSLVIEWRTFDMLENPQGDLESLHIPYHRLVDVEYKKRVVGSRIVVTADSPSVFKSFPLPSGAITTLRATIKRANRSHAPGWAAEAALRVAESDDGGDRDG
jgi:hypothetical protein